MTHSSFIVTCHDASQVDEVDRETWIALMLCLFMRQV